MNQDPLDEFMSSILDPVATAGQRGIVTEPSSTALWSDHALADAEARLSRGDCPRCGKSVALRSDGTARHHFPKDGTDRVWCAGGYPP